MKNKVMEIVGRICNEKSTNCRNLNKGNLARELMNLANIPQNAEIQEIPLDWGNQVIVLFLIPEDKENYYSLFAGIGNDGNFYFELSITGKYPCTKKFYFLEKDEILPIDYFVNKGTIDQVKISEYIKELIMKRPATDSYKYMLLDRMRQDCEYYLGYGNRNKKSLWSIDESEHIANMKALWNSFPEDKKPEWLSMENIERFEKEMIIVES